MILGLSLTSPPGPLSNTWRGGEKRILKSPLHAMGRGFRGGVNAWAKVLGFSVQCLDVTQKFAMTTNSIITQTLNLVTKFDNFS